MSQIVGEIVEKDVAQPAAYDHSEDKHQVEVFEMDGKSVVFEFTDLFAHQEVTCQKTKDVHESVPTHMQRPKAKDYGINIWKMHRAHRGKLKGWSYLGIFFKCTCSTEMAAGVIPEILDAWPRERG